MDFLGALMHLAIYLDSIKGSEGESTQSQRKQFTSKELTGSVQLLVLLLTSSVLFTLVNRHPVYILNAALGGGNI